MKSNWAPATVTTAVSCPTPPSSSVTRKVTTTWPKALVVENVGKRPVSTPRTAAAPAPKSDSSAGTRSSERSPEFRNGARAPDTATPIPAIGLAGVLLHRGEICREHVAGENSGAGGGEAERSPGPGRGGSRHERNPALELVHVRLASVSRIRSEVGRTLNRAAPVLAIPVFALAAYVSWRSVYDVVNYFVAGAAG